MTDDIREGLLYIVGHVHAPPLQQAPVLACGLPSMPTRKSVEKLYAIQQARDWIQDRIDKAKEEENTQEPLPFNSVESTPESYHEEGDAATEATPYRSSKEAQEAYIRVKLNLDPSEPTPEFSDDQWSAMRLARDYVIRGDRSLPAEEAYRLWGSHPLTGLTSATPPDEPPAIEVPQVAKVSQRRGVIYVNGTAYETYTDAARAFNIHPESLRRRLKRGWSLGQALELEPPPRAVIFKGTVYSTLSHACRAQGISYHVARKRIKEGKMPDVVIHEMLREKLLSHIAPR